MASQQTCPYCAEAIEQTDKTCPHCQSSLSGKALLANPPGNDPTPPTLNATGGGRAARVNVGTVTPISDGAFALLVLGSVATVFGLLYLSQATTGVGILSVGCFLAIAARIAQAGTHHREMMQAATTHVLPK